MIYNSFMFWNPPTKHWKFLASSLPIMIKGYILRYKCIDSCLNYIRCYLLFFTAKIAVFQKLLFSYCKRCCDTTLSLDCKRCPGICHLCFSYLRMEYVCPSFLRLIVTWIRTPVFASSCKKCLIGTPCICLSIYISFSKHFHHGRFLKMRWKLNLP